jgi:hypothetical protein
MFNFANGLVGVGEYLSATDGVLLTFTLVVLGLKNSVLLRYELISAPEDFAVLVATVTPVSNILACDGDVPSLIFAPAAGAVA